MLEPLNILLKPEPMSRFHALLASFSVALHHKPL
jgi:hypothetical protein